MNDKIKIAVGLLVVICLMFVFMKITNKPEEKEKENSRILLLPDKKSMWEYSNNKWYTYMENINKVNNIKVYENNEYKGLYDVEFISKINFFQNGNYVSFDGDILGISDNNNLFFPNYIVSENTDLEINEILQRYEIDNSNVTLSQNIKIQTDLNKDSIPDNITYISNVDAENQLVYFNIVVVNIDGNYLELIYDKIDVSSRLIAPAYKIVNIFNINEEKYSSILINRGYYSMAGSSGKMLFQYDENKYVLKINNSVKY